MKTFPPLLLLLASACATKVHVPVGAAPSVQVEMASVAVQVEDRACQAVADELVTVLRREAHVAIDPRARTRLVVHSCGQFLERTVDIEIADGADRRRLTVEGRGFAAVTVSAPGTAQATVIGATKETRLGGFGDLDPLGMSRTVERSVSATVARDLASQLSPLSVTASRRLYPGAENTSPKGLTHRAVLAELDGDLPEALRLARLAHDRRPTSRSAAYVTELQAMLRRQGHLPQP